MTERMNAVKWTLVNENGISDVPWSSHDGMVTAVRNGNRFERRWSGVWNNLNQNNHKQKQIQIPPPPNKDKPPNPPKSSNINTPCTQRLNRKQMKLEKPEAGEKPAYIHRGRTQVEHVKSSTRRERRGENRCRYWGWLPWGTGGGRGGGETHGRQVRVMRPMTGRDRKCRETQRCFIPVSNFIQWHWNIEKKQQNKTKQIFKFPWRTWTLHDEFWTRPYGFIFQ